MQKRLDFVNPIDHWLTDEPLLSKQSSRRIPKYFCCFSVGPEPLLSREIGRSWTGEPSPAEHVVEDDQRPNPRGTFIYMYVLTGCVCVRVVSSKREKGVRIEHTQGKNKSLLPSASQIEILQQQEQQSLLSRQSYVVC